MISSHEVGLIPSNFSDHSHVYSLILVLYMLSLGHFSLGHLTKHKIENLMASYFELPKSRDF